MQNSSLDARPSRLKAGGPGTLQSVGKTTLVAGSIRKSPSAANPGCRWEKIAWCQGP